MTWPRTWSALLDGRSGVSLLTEDWAEPLAGQDRGRRSRSSRSEVLDRVKARRLDRSGQFALIAATEAWADSGLADAEVDAERLGVAMASGIGGVQTLLSNYDTLLEKGPRRVSPLAIPMLMPNSPAANVGLAIGAKAGVHTPVSACASGNEAIALGIDMIRLGRADVVVCGGTEAAVHVLPMAAFANMMALSKRNDDPEAASRPWDKGRDGFVLGEGAAAVVLESAEHAEARGARIYAEAAGAGVTADSHDIAQPDPRRPRRHPGDEDRAARGRPLGPRHPRTSTPTPPRPRRATSPRPGRSARRSATPRRRRRGDLDQVDDRAPARRRRRPGVGRHGAGPVRPDRPADDQPRGPRGRRARPRRQARATCRPATWPP